MSAGGRKSRAGLRFVVYAVLVAGVLLLAPPAASAPSAAFVDVDCKESPTPDMPGQGLAGFFGPTPSDLPPAEDPFAEDAETTVYEQYGFAGMRWNNYDLGCGPDAANNPDAVIGTSVSNWIMNFPVAFASVSASLTEVAFAPTFLGVFDPLLVNVSGALHESLFARWLPAVVALIGLVILVKARAMALASTTAAVAWALFVIIVAAALFRWPVEAGRFADETVTSSLGNVVSSLGGESAADPATAVASNVQFSILYKSWLAGELGSTDSETAKEYGPALFKAQTLSWREAQLVQEDPDAGQDLIEDKQEQFGKLADQIREDDPTAYQHLTGARADTRVGYAFLASLATLFALPFLLVSSLLLLGSFIIVRLAVMLFPAFAILGLFPAARGVVLGIGRTVGAALVNAVIFGVGAAVTIVVIGLVLDPATGIPAWLMLVLLPLFSLIMWLALKPFRRLTSMAGPTSNPFQQGASLGDAGQKTQRLLKKTGAAAASAYTGGAAAGAAAAKAVDDKPEQPPERAEARIDHDTSPAPPTPARPAVVVLPALESAPATYRTDAATPTGPPPAPQWPAGAPSSVPVQRVRAPDSGVGAPPSQPTSESVPLPPTEPEWFEGEEVYAIYRPGDDHDRDQV